MSETENLSRLVLEQHHEEAFKWAMSCCDYDYETAREVMQLVYVEILDNKAVYRGESSLKTWLFSVIRRVAWRHMRPKKSMERLMAGVSELIPPENYAGDCSETLAKQRLTKNVLNALMTLSPKQRQIIELVYYRDFTLAEAAETLGMKMGSASTHFHRAKKILAKRLALVNE